jgi:hypothetical protein
MKWQMAKQQAHAIVSQPIPINFKRTQIWKDLGKTEMGKTQNA